jgi:hypothetical protein
MRAATGWRLCGEGGVWKSVSLSAIREHRPQRPANSRRMSRPAANSWLTAQSRLHNASDDTSLTKIRLPEIAGWAQVALLATL